LSIESVKPGSRAEAAGVRVGDVVHEVHYEQGRSGVPVKLVVIRGERKVPLRFMPAGASKPGRQFERVPGLPDDRC
jgi:C-terminal processing protease CtpA/Prc